MTAVDVDLITDDINPDDPPHTPERDAAERYAYSLRRTLERLAEHDAARDRLIQHIDVRHDAITAPLIAKAEWLRSSLRLYHAARLADDPSEKTVKLHAADLVSRAEQPEWVYDDEGAFLAWAEDEHPELVNNPPPPAKTPKKADVKQALKPESAGEPGQVVKVLDPKTGEVVPGLSVKLPGRAYEVKVT